MLKIILAVAFVTSLIFAYDAEKSEYEIEGFLTTQKCAELGIFKDCYLENYSCGSDECFKEAEPVGADKAPEGLVLYVHDEGKIYTLESSNIAPSVIDRAIYRNRVIVRGDYSEVNSTLYVRELLVP